MKSFLIFGILTLGGCVNPAVKFQKAHLLDPTMDPAKTVGFYNTAHDGFMIGTPERGQITNSGSVSSTCPTCGG